MAAVRLFLVDDQPIVREGLRQILEAIGPFLIVGEAGSGKEALEVIPSLQVDLAIVDISMGGTDGIELTRLLKQDHPGIGVLILSLHNDTYYVKASLDAGADGYLVKDKAHEELNKAIGSVLDGRTHLSNDVARR